MTQSMQHGAHQPKAKLPGENRYCLSYNSSYFRDAGWHAKCRPRLSSNCPTEPLVEPPTIQPPLSRTDRMDPLA